MQFSSTRHPQQCVPLRTAIAQGLAPDGGLYVPEKFPAVDPMRLAAADSLADVATQLLAPFFAGDSLAGALAEISSEALSFPALLSPLRGGEETAEVLELFHGPTAAFKDFGARFLASCMSRLPRAGVSTTTILVATSGDTGSAVAAAFHRRPGFEVVILYPRGLVSPRQEKQLTCWDDNVRTLAVRGTFDDCQRLVKAAFTSRRLAGRRAFSSANSINIGRLLPQVAYYAVAALSVWRRTQRPASFIVPSGNLGNSLACIWARQLGLPIGDIILAHNANRTVPDYLATGQWTPRPSVATLASAMDVGDPSNFERLRVLYPEPRTLAKAVSAVSITDHEIRGRIRADYSTYGRVWCPHTATAAEVYAGLPAKLRETRHWVLVATAHPAKFSEIVEPLIGGQVSIPPGLAALLALPGRMSELTATTEALEEFLLAS